MDMDRSQKGSSSTKLKFNIRTHVPIISSFISNRKTCQQLQDYSLFATWFSLREANINRAQIWVNPSTVCILPQIILHYALSNIKRGMDSRMTRGKRPKCNASKEYMENDSGRKERESWKGNRNSCWTLSGSKMNILMWFPSWLWQVTDHRVKLYKDGNNIYRGCAPRDAFQT